MSTGDQITLVPEAHTPPAHCEYASGPCDQDFATALLSDAVFLYPTTPQTISSTIEAAVEELGKVQAAKKWTTWKDFGVTGQIIFCEICKAMRFTRLVVADVTTLNFNLLFEIGVAVGLGLPILPIRDTSFKRDQKTFDELRLTT